MKYEEDGFGSRYADELINDSYCCNFDDRRETSMRSVAKDDEDEVIRKIVSLIRKCKKR